MSRTRTLGHSFVCDTDAPHRYLSWVGPAQLRLYQRYDSLVLVRISHFLCWHHMLFTMFGSEYSDDRIISLTCIHLYTTSNLNFFCHVASCPLEEYSCLLNGEPQICWQEHFTPNITPHNWWSYIFLFQDLTISINRTKMKKIIGLGKWIPEITSLSFEVKPWF